MRIFNDLPMPHRGKLTALGLDLSSHFQAGMIHCSPVALSHPLAFLLSSTQRHLNSAVPHNVFL